MNRAAQAWCERTRLELKKARDQLRQQTFEEAKAAQNAIDERLFAAREYVPHEVLSRFYAELDALCPWVVGVGKPQMPRRRESATRRGLEKLERREAEDCQWAEREWRLVNDGYGDKLDVRLRNRIKAGDGWPQMIRAAIVEVEGVATKDFFDRALATSEDIVEFS